MKGNVPRQLVWDVPTRLFHWLIVGLVAFSWWSAEYDHLDWHLSAGLAVCGLLVFRILWGIVGTDTARFSTFVKGPRAVWSYLRARGGTRVPSSPGHNPLGGWSVIALLLTLCVQVATGLFAVDVDGIESGPLSYLVDFDQGRLAAAVHAAAFNLLLALVALHVAAIMFYLVVKRRNLTRTMITGFQPDAEGSDTRVALAPWWRVLVAVLVSGLLMYGVERGFRF